MNIQTLKTAQHKVDIILLTLPRLELRSPITAPAILKACVENAGYSALCADLNLDLWHFLEAKQFGHLWFDTDLTFRHEDKFHTFWEQTLRERALYWVEYVKSINPAWVGMTIFSQRSRWICTKLCQLLKDHLPSVKIVVGGPFTEHVGPGLYQQKLVDAYVVGEGEQAILDVLAGRFDSPGINGTPPVQYPNLDQIPIPDYSDFSFHLYPKNWMDPRTKDVKNLGTDFIYITGSRGCVRKCEFCDIGSIWPKYRFRSGENIAQEMATQYQRYGSRRFLFTDSLLNGSVKQLSDLCTHLIKFKEQGLIGDVLWQGQFIARPSHHMSEDVYSLMREAGCFFVSIGVESGSEKVRNDMKKMFDNDALDFTFKSCAKYGIEVAWLLLVGYPTETEQDFQDTLLLLEKYQWINKLGLIRSIALGPTLDIVPGSPLFAKQKELGVYWDKNNNWVCGENTRVVRIQRWLRLKDKCLELGYPIVEKATEHLLMELEKYRQDEATLHSFSVGSMDRHD